MGQSIENCGGYESSYDPYKEGLAHGNWFTRDGESVHVSKMTTKHLHGARQVALKAQRRATFTRTWEQWVELFDEEIARRDRKLKSS